MVPQFCTLKILAFFKYNIHLYNYWFWDIEIYFQIPQNKTDILNGFINIPQLK